MPLELGFWRLNGKPASITEVTKRLPSGHVPEDKREYFVRVRWIKAVPLAIPDPT